MLDIETMLSGSKLPNSVISSIANIVANACVTENNFQFCNFPDNNCVIVDLIIRNLDYEVIDEALAPIGKSYAIAFIDSTYQDRIKPRYYLLRPIQYLRDTSVILVVHDYAIQLPIDDPVSLLVCSRIYAYGLVSIVSMFCNFEQLIQEHVAYEDITSDVIESYSYLDRLDDRDILHCQNNEIFPVRSITEVLPERCKGYTDRRDYRMKRPVKRVVDREPMRLLNNIPKSCKVTDNARIILTSMLNNINKNSIVEHKVRNLPKNNIVVIGIKLSVRNTERIVKTITEQLTCLSREYSVYERFFSTYGSGDSGCIILESLEDSYCNVIIMVSDYSDRDASFCTDIVSMLDYIIAYYSSYNNNAGVAYLISIIKNFTSLLDQTVSCSISDRLMEKLPDVFRDRDNIYNSNNDIINIKSFEDVVDLEVLQDNEQDTKSKPDKKFINWFFKNMPEVTINDIYSQMKGSGWELYQKYNKEV